ncbi:hypothetical protein BM1_07229 [Bipolaris maydis]|nr:hypothetical protein BM1_07229 [Bipolaris maydis]
MPEIQVLEQSWACHGADESDPRSCEKMTGKNVARSKPERANEWTSSKFDPRPAKNDFVPQMD